MNNKKTRFLPFHAINEFMRQDYRSSVVRVVLNNLADLPVDLRNSLERTINKSIQVPGFRNPGKAPAALKIKPTIESFEKKASLVAAILSAWTALHFELAHQIYDLLSQRNWEVLPLDADRTKLPGFSIKWPEEENFDLLNAAYQEKFPDTQTNSDDVSLMAVWVSMRLPYQFDAEDSDEVPGFSQAI